MMNYLAKGKILGAQCRQVVLNVYEYFSQDKKEKLRTGHDEAFALNILDQTVQATGVSKASVKRIRKSGQESGQAFETPTMKRPGARPRVMLDDFDVGAMRRMIHQMYIDGEHVTLDSIRSALEERIGISMSRSSARKNLLMNGFKFRKQDKRKQLIEKSDVVTARSAFLREMKKVRAAVEQRRIIYLDETWFNQYDMCETAWLDDENITGRKTVIGKGKRLIIVHAGSAEGFVPGALLHLRTDGKNADYHSSMDAESFEKWFAEKLLPNIPEHSIVVMDNASYHSRVLNRAPTTSWRKEDIKEWLRNNGADFEEDLLKAELLAISRRYSGVKKFFIDQFAEERGHRIIRLPPYHCDLNPIELVWAQVSTGVRFRLYVISILNYSDNQSKANVIQTSKGIRSAEN